MRRGQIRNRAEVPISNEIPPDAPQGDSPSPEVGVAAAANYTRRDTLCKHCDFCTWVTYS